MSRFDWSGDFEIVSLHGVVHGDLVSDMLSKRRGHFFLLFSMLLELFFPHLVCYYHRRKCRIVYLKEFVWSRCGADKEQEIYTSLDKKYTDFMDEISCDELYEGLLAYGLFAEKLPPVFTAVPFFNYCKTISDPFKAGWNEYITFRAMRNINVPRLMGIPNPFKYQRACSELRGNWDKIRAHFHEQTDGQSYRVSRIHVRKQYNKKRIFDMNYKNWRVDGNPELDLLIHEKGASNFLVQADISTCFPSIYTHSIPWALVGKEEAKRNINNKDVWYNRIDTACSDMRNGETHGLLIGPHASNLLSEIILTVADKKLYDSGYRYVRSIDDYECYVDSHDEAQRFLRDLEDVLREFDLTLNHKKTKVVELPVGIEKNWKSQLGDFPKVGESGMVEYPQVNTYIDTALMLATETGNFAIINYAIKKLKGSMLSDNGKKLAAKRFMHMAALYPYLLPLMEKYVFTPYRVDKCDIKALSDTIYRNAVKQNDYESLGYSIYFAVRFDFVLDEFEHDYERAQDYVIKRKDCLLLIMTWIYFMKQNHWNRSATQVKPLNRVAMELKNTDIDRYWLFCYEALTWGSLPGEWRPMKQAGISFIRKEIVDGTTATNTESN